MCVQRRRKVVTSGNKDVAPSTLDKNPNHTGSGEGTGGLTLLTLLHLVRLW